MVRTLFVKLRESVFSVLPVLVIVLLLCCTPLAGLNGREIATFCISAVLFIVGISLFNYGADLAMSPMGDYIGAGLIKTRKMSVLLPSVFAMGVFITVAEPDLSVLANQISQIPSYVLIISVGVGTGLFLLLGVMRIVFKKQLSGMLMFFYMLLFSFAALLFESGKGDFLPLSFDSGGVTTGPITAPFIMAVGAGIAATLGGKDTSENSFGLLALSSVGPVLTVLILGLTLNKGDISGMQVFDPNKYVIADNVAASYLSAMWRVTKEVGLALGLIIVFFAVLQLICLKLPRIKLAKLAIGLAYTFVGLVLFLTSVSVGFLPVGFKLGQSLAQQPAALIAVGVVLGAVVVLAEPAIHVLNRQVEEVTNRVITKRAMLIALSVGEGIAIGLSVLRIYLDFSLLYYIIPGYLLSLGLSFFVPRIYTAIAFDSGGVASGPLTSTFILPFAIGACCVLQGENKVLTDAFGVVAMVAMTPLITIQVLGFRAIMTRNIRNKIAQKRILSADDDQIINFM